MRNYRGKEEKNAKTKNIRKTQIQQKIWSKIPENEKRQ